MPKLRMLRLFTAALLLLSFGCMTANAQSGFEVFKNYDLPGGDYLAIEGPSYDQCAGQCARDTACRAFTYNLTKRVCFLKDRTHARKKFAGAISARKSTQKAGQSRLADAPTFEVFADVDMPGGDFEVLRNTSLDQCQQACASQPVCQAFTQNVAKGVCFLKSGAGEPEHFAGAVSGRRIGESRLAQASQEGKPVDGFLMYEDTDLPGGDGAIIDQKPGDAEACRLLCLFDDDCDAFTYNHKVGACLGKSRRHIGGDRMRPTAFKGATSGLKAAPAKVAAARTAYFARGPKTPEADLGWREDDTAATFVRRLRTAAGPMGGRCETERDRISGIARTLRAKIQSETVTAGVPFGIEWDGKPAADAPPVWLMISADGPVRFTAPGFYALTPEAIAPFGIAVDSQRTRALTTLFGQGAMHGGKVEIMPLRAGSLNISIRAVGYLRRCEEEVSRDVAMATITVTASTTPTFQVRDPFTFEVPDKAWRSPDGSTKLEAYAGRFRVIDAASGAFIVDRDGTEPNYSPTGRFVSFQTAEFGNQILDTLDGSIVKSTLGVIGWENRDSFLVDGKMNGNVSASSLLVASTEFGSFHRCRAACPGREETYTLDLENDFIHVSGTSDRLSGERQPVLNLEGETKAKTLRTVAEQTGVAPVYFPARWNFRGGLFFAPSGQPIDPSAGGQLDVLQEEENKHMFFADPLEADKAPRTASLAAVGIGQWRGVKRLERPASVQNTVKDRLIDLGLRFSPSDEADFVAIKPADLDPTESLNFMQPEIAARIVAAVPSAKGAFVDARETYGCNPPDKTAPNGLNAIWSSFDKAMEFRIGRRSIWLTMFVCVEGAAAFYFPNFHFFDSAYDQGFLRIDGTNPNENTGSACATDISYCNFDARLYGDRYLLIWSTESRGIMLFDVTERKTVYKNFDLGRGDLLKEAFYSLETQHITQLNTDGSFFVYDVPGKKRVLEGRYVDDETVAWTPDLRFDASPEGANYVYLRFPGQSGQYAFQQFAAEVKRPGIVKDVMERRYKPVQQDLKLPPTLAGQIEVKGGRVVGDLSMAGASEIRTYQDGLLTDTQAATGTSAHLDVEHIAGARWISLVALDSTGLASLPIGMHVPRQQDPLPTVHLLSVGIDRYRALQSLSYASRDAATMFGALTAQDGKTLRLGVANSLVDEAAAPEAILERATQMIDSARKGETVVFSFAGHGVTDASGRFFLATSGTDASRIAETALAWDRLSAVLARAQARVVVFLDACHSGAAGTGLFATNDDAVNEVLAGVPSGLLVFSASKGRQFSEESASAGGGLFTNAVADVIARDREKHDLDGNGAIEASELYVGVKRIVANSTSGRQVPWLARNEMVGDFAIF